MGVSEALKTLKWHIVSRFEPVQLSLMRSGSDLMETVGRRMETGTSAAAAWMAIKQDRTVGRKWLSAYTEGDTELLDRLFGELGQSGRQAQGDLIDGVQEALRARIRSLETEARAADKLYGPLGLLLGLMLALILL